MSTQSNAAPVIIKRKKVVGGGGHHGGAWKVAYADFVTAMMAFFLLMWLLNATTEKQRKGIADYFSPTIAISRISGGGDGSFGGDSVFSENTLPQMGTGATSMRVTESNQARGESGLSEDGAEKAREDEVFKQMEMALMGRGGESMVTSETLRHIVTRVTDEGLVIELFDLDGAPLFEGDTAVATPLLEELAQMLVNVFRLIENPVAVEGHVASQPLVLMNNPVWKLSADRADQMRILLEQQGIRNDRVQRVTGHADREPESRNPMSFRNNRLEVVLLREVR
ncbi:MAG: flagellar motor protein MotB [Paracoccaceae bacterium]